MMKLYYNPISAYSQKVLIAFYEKNIAFTPVVVDLMGEAARAEYEKVYPIGKVPFVVDEEKGNLEIPESSIIIEYLDMRYPQNPPRLIPQEPMMALQTRRWDRFFDNYLNDPMQKILFDGMRPVEKRDVMGVEVAKKRIAHAYGMLEKELGGKTWMMGNEYTLADCAATVALNYLRMVQPFTGHKNIEAYAKRLVERPSFMKAFKEAEPILKSMKML